MIKSALKKQKHTLFKEHNLYIFMYIGQYMQCT